MKPIYRIAIFLFLLIVMPTVALLFHGSARPQAGALSSFNMRLQLNAAGVPVNVLWDYDFTQPTNKPCTTTLLTNCVAGFNIWTNDVNGKMVGTGSTLFPATISTTGVTTGISFPYVAPTTNLGTYVINIQTSYRDSAGAQQGGMSSGITWSIPSGPLNVRLQ